MHVCVRVCVSVGGGLEVGGMEGGRGGRDKGGWLCYNPIVWIEY